MCVECGCSQHKGFEVVRPVGSAGHPAHEGQSHGEGHRHFDEATGTWFEHVHAPKAQPSVIELHEPILARNDRLAERNRGFFEAHGVRAINLMSSPGSGKTTLLEKTIGALQPASSAAVLVGDLATDLDGQRLDGRGAQVLQITTGTACHLDAVMVAEASRLLNWDGLKLLLIENVGNLVCPASFDIGESHRVVLFSVTEGEDKPLKYPPVFHRADLVVVTKIDLSHAVEFDRPKAMSNLAIAAPHACVIELSARTGEGMNAWLEWLQS